MKSFFICALLMLLFNIVNSQQPVNGRYRTTIKKGANEYLSINVLNDTTFIFGFNSQKNNLNFNKTTVFGVAHLEKNKWVGVIDASYMDREFGDFTEEEKKKGKGFFTEISFSFSEDSIYINTVYSNIRGFVDANYKLIDTVPLGYKIGPNYKELGYAYLVYKASYNTPLYFLPERLLRKEILLRNNELVSLENEYKEFVFVVKYNSQNKVIKSGWVNRKCLKFVEKRPYSKSIK